MVDGAVDEGGGHVLVAEHASPSAEFDVGGVDDAPCLVGIGNDLEEEPAALLVYGQVAELVDDEKSGLADAREFPVEPVLLLGAAQTHEQSGRGEEAHRDAPLAGEPSDRDGQVGLAAADVAVDLPAGPSEVLVLADEDARPEFAAADLLSQAEHGDDSQAVLVCRSEEFAQRAIASVGEQAARLSRRDAIGNSLANSRIVLFDEEYKQIAFANAYAPEHLIVSMRDAWGIAAKITAAGSVFIGNYSPESAGDYASGTNHTLPTGGWARACSGVNVDSFMRKITFQELTRDGLDALAPAITAMAEAEGLDAHANAVRVRMKGGIL